MRGGCVLWRLCCVTVPPSTLPSRRVRSRSLMPKCSRDLGAGAVTVSHAQVLAGLARHPRFRDAYASEQGEPLLLGHARGLEFREFQLAVEYWKLHVDEDGTEKAAEDDYEARNVEVLDGLRSTGLL